MSKLFLHIAVILLFIFVVCSETVFAKRLDLQSQKALNMVKTNSGLVDSVSQLLVVFSEKDGKHIGSLVALEKKGRNWKVAAAPVEAGIGRNGFADPGEKREGDSQSPTGLFRLGQLFCYEKIVNTRMPYIQTSPEDKWIDDPESPDYNRYIRGATSAKSYENLLLNGNDYRYCMAIEYNMHPIIKGNGSAIFLHISEGKTVKSSSGCVVLLQKDMESLLKWMNPKRKPSILMGNEKVLMSGLKNKK